jgi:hypothetical protein
MTSDEDPTSVEVPQGDLETTRCWERKDARQGMAHEMRITELKDRVAREDYVVDPQVVAEALLSRTGILLCLAGDAFSPRRAGSLSPAARLRDRGN